MFVDIGERAKARQSARFDLKQYYAAVLRHGGVPLDVLRRIGNAWIAA